MYTDTISDLLTRIRNASRVKHRFVEVPFSKFKVSILDVLKDQGYIANFKVFE
jgi:small subunit ribosomal protein S8